MTDNTHSSGITRKKKFKLEAHKYDCYYCFSFKSASTTIFFLRFQVDLFVTWLTAPLVQDHVRSKNEDTRERAEGVRARIELRCRAFYCLLRFSIGSLHVLYELYSAVGSILALVNLLALSLQYMVN